MAISMYLSAQYRDVSKYANMERRGRRKKNRSEAKEKEREKKKKSTPQVLFGKGLRTS